MTIYYLNDDDTIESINIEDIANLEAFERELDECYPLGWSEDKGDLVVGESFGVNAIPSPDISDNLFKPIDYNWDYGCTYIGKYSRIRYLATTRQCSTTYLMTFAQSR